MIVLETERLFLRELKVSDGQHFYNLNLDKEVLKYTGDHSFNSVHEAEEFLSNYHHYKKYGYGRWAVIQKQDEAFLGWCGLKCTLATNEVDIGFRFFKKYWNKGFATEAAEACLKIGFEKFNITSIVGRAMIKNKPSIKVLEKIGLVYDKPFDFDGEEGVIYKTS